jgi:hypothetical protein
VGERYADGMADEQDRARAWYGALQAKEEAVGEQDFQAAIIHRHAQGTVETVRDRIVWAQKKHDYQSSYFLWDVNDPLRQSLRRENEATCLAQCAIFRDIFGNPFRLLPPRPEAIAPLAEQIYAGAWDKMPQLGKWLQEHGYPTEAEHCLDPNIHHVKGCWVVDWATGRE